MAAVLATGNQGWVEGMALPAGLPAGVAAAFAPSDEAFAGVLVEGNETRVRDAVEAAAALPRSG